MYRLPLHSPCRAGHIHHCRGRRHHGSAGRKPGYHSNHQRLQIRGTYQGPGGGVGEEVECSPRPPPPGSITGDSVTLQNLHAFTLKKNNVESLHVSVLFFPQIVDLWQCTDFRYVAHAERDTFIIAGADDIMAQLEESQVTIATIRGSRYVGPIKGQVEEWERKLNIFAKTLEEWMNCQRNWLYLEQIFSTPDISR